MAQTFTDPPKNFATNTADANRYAKQLAALEQRWLNAGRETGSWRIMTFVATGIAVAATAGALFVASQRPTAAVHVVEIDSHTWPDALTITSITSGLTSASRMAPPRRS